MQQSKLILALLITLFFTGCSNIATKVERDNCIVGTSVAGAGLGNIASPLGGIAGMVGGGIVGLFICGDAAPAPAPAPEPEMTGNFITPDDDNDGVPNDSDECPFTNPAATVEPNGCAVDSDGDGVPDYLDQCPGTPLGTAVDETGCAKVLARLNDVHFAFDSAVLTSKAKSILDGIISRVKAHPSSDISVEGHTDSTGPENYNQGLSQRRAEAVVNYLTSRGVSSSRLRAVGKGENSPVASNDTASGRSLNRRVVILAN